MTLPALNPITLRGLRLRNRFVKAGTFEGMTPKGAVSEQLVSFHAKIASHNVGLTTVSYAAVSEIGRTFPDQLLVDKSSVIGFRRIADEVHFHGGAVSLQLAHCGGFSKFQKPIGPSRRLNLYGIAAGFPIVRAMTDDEILRTIEDFASAASLAQEAGIDAVEIHLGHGYLLSQFLSPLTNRRSDRWGGSLEGRLRLPLDVIRAVRNAVGDEFPILAKTNLQDGIPGGLELNGAIQAAKELVAAGVDAIIPSGGMVQKNAFFLLRGDVPIRQMVNAESSFFQRFAMRALAPWVIRRFDYRSSFFFDDASRLRDAVDVPVGLLGGVDSAMEVDSALSAGFGFVVLGRALLADPDFAVRYANGEQVVTRCNHCNECIANMNQGVRCVLGSRD